MKTAIIIPARYASSRLPAKPLLRETGKFLVQHVYERALESQADRVVVATDDLRIFEAVRSFDGEAMMTRDDHPSGTDRVAEVAAKLDVDLIVNLQGDEPTIDPADLNLVAELLANDPGAEIATLSTPIRSMELYQDPNCVKVVRDALGRALYFSRSPIPYVRDGKPDFATGEFLQHLGLYAYRRDCLLRLAQLPADRLETTEKLEQLRWLSAGRRIQVGVVADASRGVDTPEDYRRFVAFWNQTQAKKSA